MPLRLAYAADPGTDLLRTGLHAYWPMEEGSGPRVDAAIGGSHLTQDGVSAVTSTTGKVGAAAAVMTAGQLHNLQRTKLALTSSWFIAGWFKLLNTGQDSYLVSRDDAGSNRAHWLRHSQGDSKIYAGVSTDGSDSNEVGADAPSQDNWSLIIYGWDATAEAVFLSVDGSDLASEAVGGGWNSGSNIDFMVGGRNPASPQNNTSMHVDHLGVWTGVDLTAEHIALLHNGGDGVAVYGGR